MNESKTQQRKKILFIHHGIGIGGASLSLLYLVQSLDKKQFEPYVLFMQDSAAVTMFSEHKINTLGPLNLSDFSHTKIWWYRWYHPHHLFKAVRDSLKLLFFVATKWLAEIKPDLVHLNTSSLFAWAIIARRNNIPVFWHIREPLADGYFGLRKKFICWVVGKFASTIIPICQDNALPWIENNKMHVIYNAVPEDKFKSECFLTDEKKANNNPTPESQHAVLFLGGLSQEKGTLLLLQSWQLVLQQLPDAQLLVAGNWEPKLGIFNNRLPLTSWHRYCKKTIRLAETLKNNVKIIGVQQDVPQLLSQTDLLVFPATAGHFARPVIEAGFMQKPTVATDLAPMRELILDGETGLLSTPNDAKDLALKILLILENKAVAESLGKKAAQFCHERFGLKKQQKIMAKLYEKA